MTPTQARRSAALARRLGVGLGLGGACVALALAATPAPKSNAELWGAIATVGGFYGYSYNQPTAAAAQSVARSQCERKAGRNGPCLIRSTFERACAAMATGNYGEWGVASAPTIERARSDATAQCDSHLPTEPCKVQVAVCSGVGAQSR